MSARLGAAVGGAWWPSPSGRRRRRIGVRHLLVVPPSRHSLEALEDAAAVLSVAKTA
ncbi:hypothetical protein ACF1B0_21190 [Streptomyces anandii]|uniref:hypothetical protein n=1 Tax=Streptomyces anandii TaxID=285454 RepID=UPI0036F9842A